MRAPPLRAADRAPQPLSAPVARKVEQIGQIAPPVRFLPPAPGTVARGRAPIARSYPSTRQKLLSRPVTPLATAPVIESVGPPICSAAPAGGQAPGPE